MKRKYNEVSAEKIVQDGGWGWIVVTSAFFVMFMIDGLFGSYGLLLPVLMESLLASPSVTSLAGSLIVGSLLFTALLALPLIERFGCRIVSILGAFTAALGLVLSSFVENIWMFLVTYGLLTGCGLGLMYLPSIVMVNRYFEEKRGIATSITFAGSGIGMMVISPFVEKLLDFYDWRGTLLILAGLFMQLCVACALYRPPKVILHQIKNINHCVNNTNDIEICVNQEEDFVNPKGWTDIVTDCEKNLMCDSSHSKESFGENVYHLNFVPLERSDNFKSSTCSLPKNMFRSFNSTNKPSLYFSSSHCVSDPQKSLLSGRSKLFNKPILSQKDILYSGSLNHLKHSNSVSKNLLGSKSFAVCEKVKLEIPMEGSGCDSSNGNEPNGSLITNKAFWCVAIGAFLTQMAQFIPNLFLGDIGLNIGLTSRDVSWMFSVFGVVNTIGRLLPGFVIDHTRMKSTGLCTMGMAGCAVTCFLFPLCNSFATLMTFSIFYGFFIAFFCPLQPIMVLDSVGLDNLTKGLSILTVIKGPAAIVGPPFAGVLYEWTKNYSITIIFAGCLCLLTALVYVIHPIYRYVLSVYENKTSDEQYT